jgi:hypothetical protein
MRLMLGGDRARLLAELPDLVPHRLRVALGLKRWQRRMACFASLGAVNDDRVDRLHRKQLSRRALVSR